MRTSKFHSAKYFKCIPYLSRLAFFLHSALASPHHVSLFVTKFTEGSMQAVESWPTYEGKDCILMKSIESLT